MNKRITFILIIFIIFQTIFAHIAKASTSVLLPRNAPNEMQELLVDIYVNGVDSQKLFYLLKDKTGAFWISLDNLHDLNLKLTLGRAKQALSWPR